MMKNDARVMAEQDKRDKAGGRTREAEGFDIPAEDNCKFKGDLVVLHTTIIKNEQSDAFQVYHLSCAVAEQDAGRGERCERRGGEADA